MRESSTVDAVEDFEGVSLGDLRLDKRLARVATNLQAAPTASFPDAMKSDAGAEAFYRFINNDAVEWRTLLDGHVEATHRRCVDAGVVLAVHDSSLMQFSGEGVREGTFRTSRGKSGFLAHMALAVSADGSRRPLGVLDLLPVVRAPATGASSSETWNEGRDGQPGILYDNEADRWLHLVERVEDGLPQEVEVIHVMDSEGDDYTLLSGMIEAGAQFVVRGCHDRRVLVGDSVRRLDEVLAESTVRLERTVKLAARVERAAGPPAKGRRSPRDERMAALAISASHVRILRPEGSDAALPHLDLWVVEVTETAPPEGQEPVRWTLLTSRPLRADDDLASIVDFYRTRWLIEEWFKSLKTGCAYTSRQLESLANLLTAFALFAPIATRLLDLRWFGRNEPDRPATDVLTKSEIKLLCALDTATKRKRIQPDCTVHEAMIAIARLGGFLTRNKVPGWQVLGRGFEQFRLLHAGFELASRGVVEM